MQLLEGGPYLNKDFHRFVPYRHYNMDYMWLVLHYEDIYPVNYKEGNTIVKTIESRWNVIADTPLLAALEAQKNWERDHMLIFKYNRRTDHLNSLFKELVNMDLDNIKKFDEIVEPLMCELTKRNRDTDFVSDAQFYSNIIIMINRFNTIIKDMIKKEKK